MTSDIDAAGLMDGGEWLQTRPRERCLVAAAETNGASSVVEMVSHSAHNAPMHVHQNKDDHFLILGDTARTVRGSESFDCSRPRSSVAERHFESADHLRQAAGSSLVRRIVLAKDDPVKQRIRAWLSDIDVERLLSFGLTSEDIATLRDSASPPAKASITQRLDAPSEDSGAS